MNPAPPVTTTRPTSLSRRRDFCCPPSADHGQRGTSCRGPASAQRQSPPTSTVVRQRNRLLSQAASRDCGCGGDPDVWESQLATSLAQRRGSRHAAHLRRTRHHGTSDVVRPNHALVDPYERQAEPNSAWCCLVRSGIPEGYAKRLANLGRRSRSVPSACRDSLQSAVEVSVEQSAEASPCRRVALSPSPPRSGDGKPKAAERVPLLGSHLPTSSVGGRGRTHLVSAGTAWARPTTPRCAAPARAGMASRSRSCRGHRHVLELGGVADLRRVRRHRLPP